MVNDLSDMLLDSFCHYFFEDFCIYVYQGDWAVVLLFGDDVILLASFGMM
jgi:hypothetical protein